MHHFAGQGRFRAGELVEHHARDPEERFWWLEYTPEYDGDWEELELDSAEIERVTTLVASVSERLGTIRDLWMRTEDRLVLVYEQLGHAVRAARMVEAGDVAAKSAQIELADALALAAGEALLASTRLRQLDQFVSTEDALRAEAAEVAATISQNYDLADRGQCPLDWILHALEWAAEARQSLRVSEGASRGAPLIEELITGQSAESVQLQFQLVATECATALALFGPETIVIGDVSVAEVDSGFDDGRAASETPSG